MNTFTSFFSAHSSVLELVGFWLFSAAVGNMPAPTQKSSTFYVWLYGTINAIAANVDLVAKARGIRAPIPPPVPPVAPPPPPAVGAVH